MATIRTNCPACGEVSLTPADIQLHADVEGGAVSSYAFSCPDCLLLVHKQADERAVRLLTSAGVACTVVGTDGPAAPPFTYDDLLDFHALLRTDGWFDDLLQRPGR